MAIFRATECVLVKHLLLSMFNDLKKNYLLEY